MNVNVDTGFILAIVSALITLIVYILVAVAVNKTKYVTKAVRDRTTKGLAVPAYIGILVTLVVAILSIVWYATPQFQSTVTVQNMLILGTAVSAFFLFWSIIVSVTLYQNSTASLVSAFAIIANIIILFVSTFFLTSLRCTIPSSM